MCDCWQCKNQEICVISKDLEALYSKYQHLAEIVVQHCYACNPIESCLTSSPISREKASEEIVSEERAPESVSISTQTLDKLGLGMATEQIAAPLEAQPTDQPLQLCPCCQQVVPVALFEAADVCSHCGQAVCMNCAIQVEGRILCDNCF